MKVKVNTEIRQSSSATDKYSLRLQSIWVSIKPDIYSVKIGSDSDIYLSRVRPRESSRGFFLTPQDFRKHILNGSIHFISDQDNITQ